MKRKEIQLAAFIAKYLIQNCGKNPLQYTVYTVSTKTTQSGKITQVPMFTSKGCDIGRGDARRVDTQKIL